MLNINESNVDREACSYRNQSNGKLLRFNKEGKELRLAEIKQFLRDDGRSELDIFIRPANGDFDEPVSGVICSNNFLNAELCPKCDDYNLLYEPHADKPFKCFSCSHTWIKENKRGRPASSSSKNSRYFAKSIKPDYSWIGCEDEITPGKTKSQHAKITVYNQLMNFYPALYRIDKEQIQYLRKTVQSPKMTGVTKVFIEFLCDCLLVGEEVEAQKLKLSELEKMKAELLNKKLKIDNSVTILRGADVDKDVLYALEINSSALLEQVQGITEKINELKLPK